MTVLLVIGTLWLWVLRDEEPELTALQQEMKAEVTRLEQQRLRAELQMRLTLLAAELDASRSADAMRPSLERIDEGLERVVATPELPRPGSIDGDLQELERLLGRDRGRALERIAHLRSTLAVAPEVTP